jgi:endonuclease-8
MPEGHTIHREARLQSRQFVGEPVRVWSPQGRFDSGASLLDGNVIQKVEAWGKHLFYHWDHGHCLHVHLGLFGRFRRYQADPPPPTDGTRLAITGTSGTLYLSGPTVCEIVDPEEREEILSGLGPDPLRPGSHPEPVGHIQTMLGRRTVPVAAALLDQTVVAGIGNVYRSEILFRTGLNPLTESKRIGRDSIEGIWKEAVTQLEAGERSGRIVTTDPDDVGRAKRRDIEKGERTYVYKRQGEPCRRCGTGIERTEAGGRKVWWCPECQPA